jgi:hypothetical protein
MAYFRFKQSTGELFFIANESQVEGGLGRVEIQLRLGSGYAGKGVAKNNPAFQQIKETGPLPQGTYEIGVPHNTDTHGPYVMNLTPKPENNMFGREAFLLHGDSIKKPGEASLGCPVLGPELRKIIGGSGYKILEVVA